jgi:hypothetical protein
MELGPVILDYFGDTFLVELGYQFHSGYAQPPLPQSAKSQWIRTADASAVCDKKMHQPLSASLL